LALLAPGGVVHLVLEVLAYAVDEAVYRRSAHVVTLHSDGSVTLLANVQISGKELRRLADALSPHLCVEVNDHG
jgi:hypothetical protein